MDLPTEKEIDARTETESPDTKASKLQLDAVLDLFRSLIEESLQASNLPDSSKQYFDPIICWLNIEMVLLEIRAFEVGCEGPDFGKSARLSDSGFKVTKFLTELLEYITSRLNTVAANVHAMRSLIASLSGKWYKDL